MKTILNPVVLLDEDYQILRTYLTHPDAQGTGETLSFASEIRRAIIVNKLAFPNHTIRLGSKVTLFVTGTKTKSRFTIVLPEEADLSERKISVLSPIGAALIGFRETEDLEMKVPAGIKKFKIMEVKNGELE